MKFNLDREKINKALLELAEAMNKVLDKYKIT